MNNSQDQMHPSDKRNLVIFFVTAIAIWLSYEHFILGPKMDALREARERAQATPTTVVHPIDGTTIRHTVAEALAATPRVGFENDVIVGSIDLQGGRINDLQLKEHLYRLDGEENITLLAPSGTEFPHYADFGWLTASRTHMALPGPDTRWQVAGGTDQTLTPDNPLTLFWDNGQGLRFEHTVTLDDRYLFSITQRVINNSEQQITLYPYSLVARHGLPEEIYGLWLVHEGPIGYIGNDLTEYSYRKMRREITQSESMARTGWIGITQKYWFVGLIPDQTEETKFRFVHAPPPSAEGRDRYQVDTIGSARTIAPGQSAESTVHLFTGAKEIQALEHYERLLDIPHFDLVIDFGLFYFLTRPLFHLLQFLHSYIPNLGIAIIVLTIIIRLCVFPLANTSYRSFAKLRKIAPQMKELREQYGTDREKLQKELVALYEREKVNPMAGCLPILIQIPIFFALYKVFLVTLEMRHEPFFGWIQDLSAPDPTSIFNLFGLIPWDPPSFMMIGAWPMLMLFFMLLQRNMNPPPQDKMQAYMINFMPFFITYILSGFAAGLVIYWTFSNALSIVQQYIIMRSMGVEVKFFHRPKVEKELEEQVKEGPSIHPELEYIEEEIEESLFGKEEEQAKTITPPKKKKKGGTGGKGKKRKK